MKTQTYQDYQYDKAGAHEAVEIITRLGPEKGIEKIYDYRFKGFNHETGEITEPYYTASMIMTAVYIALYGENLMTH